MPFGFSKNNFKYTHIKMNINKNTKITLLTNVTVIYNDEMYNLQMWEPI